MKGCVYYLLLDRAFRLAIAFAGIVAAKYRNVFVVR